MRQSRRAYLRAAALGAAGLAGCSTVREVSPVEGPGYDAPVVGESNQEVPSFSYQPTGWWRRLGDARNTAHVAGEIAGKPTLEWDVTVPGVGAAPGSPPVAVDGTVYNDDQTGGVRARDASTGAETWEARAFPRTGSPAVVGGVVFAGAPKGGVVAVDATTGEHYWNAGDDPVPTSPLVVDETVIYGTEPGTFVARNVADGSEQWRYSTNERVRAAPAAANGIVTCRSATALHALDLADGSRRWRTSVNGQTGFAPQIAGETVLAPTGSELTAYDLHSGEQRWVYGPDYGMRTQLGVLSDRNLLVASTYGSFTGIDVADGSIIWETEADDWRPEHTGLLVVGDTVLFALDGKLRAANLDGTRRWSRDLGYEGNAILAATARGVYAATSHDTSLLGFRL